VGNFTPRELTLLGLSCGRVATTAEVLRGLFVPQPLYNSILGVAMRKTLPLISLLKKANRKELLQLSALLGWGKSEKDLTKDELAARAVRDIRNLGSTALGNVFRLGDPITYRELLDDLYNNLQKEIKKLNSELRDELYDDSSDELNDELYEKHKAKLPGNRTIQNMEGALALRFLEEVLRNVKNLPLKDQHKLKDGFNKSGLDSPDKLLELISLEGSDAWEGIIGGGSFAGAGIGGSILGGLALINPLLGGAAVIAVVASALGFGTDLFRARAAILYVFIFRQKYNQPARRRVKPKSRENLHPDPLKIALIGRVSSGKSATINAIFGVKATPVSPIPGSTTEVKGFKVTEKIILFDTPGLEDSSNPRYSEKAVTFAKESDVVLFIVNAQQITDTQKNVFMELKRWKLPYLVILNKLDTIRGDQEAFAEQIRKEKLGCEKRWFLSGSLNPRNVDEWDTAKQVLEKINWVVKAKRSQIDLNREVVKIMKNGLEGLGAVSDPLEREKLSGIMNRLGLGQN